MINWIVETFEQVEDLITDASQSPWFFLILFSVAFIDSVIPIAPSEFAVIAGGVASGAGTLISSIGSPAGTLLAAFLWATYAGVLGYLFGDAFENQSTALWVAFATALSVSVSVELFRAARSKRKAAAPGA